MRLARATALVTAVLAIVEALQTRIPGHVPEINDPLLAVLLFLGLMALRDRREAVASASEPRHRRPVHRR
jgi:hypothetical protein